MTDDAPAREQGDVGLTAREQETSGFTAREQRAAVRERYADIATGSSTDDERESSGDDPGSSGDDSSCCGSTSSCCDDADADDDALAEHSRELGYADEDLAAVDPDANLGLGCGNPTGIASLGPGDDVLDLGSGAGFDCFLAAREVGAGGRVVGVDMTPEMVEKARENAAANDATNVEFRLGEIEHLPVADESIDVILSNCVVNLSPDKPQVFREASRVLRPGGRLAVSDVVLTAEIPPEKRADPASVAACVSGAAPVPALERMLTDAGFANVSVEPKADSESFIREWDDERDLSDYVVAATIEGEKPETGAPS